MQFRSRFVGVQSIITAGVAAVALLGALSSGIAADNIIYGTGVDKDPIGAETYQRDNHWKIVAVAKDFLIPGGESAPYDAYVPYSISFNWFGGNSPVWGGNNGFEYKGVTYHWISPYTSADYAPFPSSWNFIAAQTFTISESGLYEFNFLGNGDNSMAFFINGSITGTDTNQPTIVGGTQIGTTQGGDTGTLYQYTGSIYLTAGTHTAYAQVVDTGFQGGAFITNSSFQAVPEPSTVLFLTLGAGFVAFKRLRSSRQARS